MISGVCLFSISLISTLHLFSLGSICCSYSLRWMPSWLIFMLPFFKKDKHLRLLISLLCFNCLLPVFMYNILLFSVQNIFWFPLIILLIMDYLEVCFLNPKQDFVVIFLFLVSKFIVVWRTTSTPSTVVQLCKSFLTLLIFLFISSVTERDMLKCPTMVMDWYVYSSDNFCFTWFWDSVIRCLNILNCSLFLGIEPFLLVCGDCLYL